MRGDEAEAQRLEAEAKFADLAARGVKDFEVVEDGVKKRITLEQQKAAQIRAINDAEAKRIDEAQKKTFEKDKKAAEKRIKAEQVLNEQRVSAVRQTLSNIEQLTGTKNKALSAINKTASISIATQDAFAAANKALRSAPPPFGQILAASTLALGLQNVQRIAAAQEGGRFPAGKEVLVGEEGPEIVKFGAPAEVKTAAETQTRLDELAEGAGGSGINVTFTGGINVNITAANLSDPTTRREIAQALSEEIMAETEEAITLARRSSELNERNSERAV